MPWKPNYFLDHALAIGSSKADQEVAKIFDANAATIQTLEGEKNSFRELWEGASRRATVYEQENRKLKALLRSRQAPAPRPSIIAGGARGIGR
jgi:hypothetical protein